MAVLKSLVPHLNSHVCGLFLQVNFNRGARNEKVTWEYGGGDTFTFWVESKDFEEKMGDDNKSLGIGLYMDGKAPSTPIQEFDLVRVCLMPKSNDSLSKSKKTCFAFKGLGGCSRTLVSYLPLLKDQSKVCRSVAEATEKAEKTIREGKHEWAHQLSMSSGTDGDFSNCEARTVSFLETNISGQTTFIYQSSKEDSATGGGDMVRMCVKGTSSYSMYHIDMPIHQVRQCSFFMEKYMGVS